MYINRECTSQLIQRSIYTSPHIHPRFRAVSHRSACLSPDGTYQVSSLCPPAIHLSVDCRVGRAFDTEKLRLVSTESHHRRGEHAICSCRSRPALGQFIISNPTTSRFSTSQRCDSRSRNLCDRLIGRGTVAGITLEGFPVLARHRSLLPGVGALSRKNDCDHDAFRHCRRLGAEQERGNTWDGRKWQNEVVDSAVGSCR